MTEKQLVKGIFKNCEVYFRGVIDNYVYGFYIIPCAWSNQRFKGEYRLHVPEEDECKDRYMKKLLPRERKNMIAIISALLFKSAFLDENAAIEYENFKKKYGEEK